MYPRPCQWLQGQAHKLQGSRKSSAIPDCGYREFLHPRHSRHWLSGIHLSFFSDGSPLPTAGM